MKKILLILVLWSCISSANCQHLYKIQSNTTAWWDNISKTYNWGTKHYVDMDLTMKGSIILVSDEAGSAYVAGQQITNEDKADYQQYLWAAVDEKKRTCYIKMLYPKSHGKLTGDFQLYILYKDFAVAYDISNN